MKASEQLSAVIEQLIDDAVCRNLQTVEKKIEQLIEAVEKLASKLNQDEFLNKTL